MNKKINIIVIALALSVSACYGPFNLTKKLYNFNGGIGDKYINALAFIGMNIVPIYGFAVAADAIVFNSIEFWTGSNPIAMNSDDIDIQKIAVDGVEMKVTATQNQFIVQNLETNKTHSLIFNPELKTWSIQNENLELHTFATIVETDDGLNYQYILNDGNTILLDQFGHQLK